MMEAPQSVLDFWFVEHGRDDWFGGKPEFDRKLAQRFAGTHAAVARGEAWTWRATPEGRLAEILVLDQFSRQVHRGSPLAFASDDMALALAQEAVAGGHDRALEKEQRRFVYMPYMHSESLVIHDEAMRLFTALGDPDTLKFEELHAECLRRFGRYPRRNSVLGRQSTAEEIAYIESGSGLF
jgi:uncharacterized protein (DUF924 family)